MYVCRRQASLMYVWAGLPLVQRARAQAGSPHPLTLSARLSPSLTSTPSRTRHTAGRRHGDAPAGPWLCSVASGLSVRDSGAGRARGSSPPLRLTPGTACLGVWRWEGLASSCSTLLFTNPNAMRHRVRACNLG